MTAPGLTAATKHFSTRVALATIGLLAASILFLATTSASASLVISRPAPGSQYDLRIADDSVNANWVVVSLNPTGSLNIRDASGSISSTVPTCLPDSPGLTSYTCAGFTFGNVDVALGPEGDRFDYSVDPLTLTHPQLTVDGGSGIDLITGGPSSDRLVGGPGDDHIAGVDGNDALVGGSGVDHLHGGLEDDELSGNDGDDIVNGNEGDDTLIGGTGDDTLDGGIGVNIASYEDRSAPVNVFAASSSSNGVAGENDNLTAIEGIRGGSGDDHLFGSNANNVIEGGGGSDVIEGRDGQDVLRGDDGDDQISAGNGRDGLEGGDGDDNLDGGLDRDYFNGGDGSRDIIDYSHRSATGSVRADLSNPSAEIGASGEGDRFFGGIEGLNGGDANDVLIGDNGQNFISGGGGDDVITGGFGEDQLFGDIGNDQLDGGGENDLLNGGQNEDRLRGSAGDDLLDGGIGDDELDGGTGANDTVDYSQRSLPITAEIGSSSGNGETALGESDDLSRGVEDLVGSPQNDDLTGSSVANQIFGFDGDDTIHVRGGEADTVYCLVGNDRVIADRTDIFPFGSIPGYPPDCETVELPVLADSGPPPGPATGDSHVSGTGPSATPTVGVPKPEGACPAVPIQSTSKVLRLKAGVNLKLKLTPGKFRPGAVLTAQLDVVASKRKRKAAVRLAKRLLSRVEIRNQNGALLGAVRKLGKKTSLASTAAMSSTQATISIKLLTKKKSKKAPKSSTLKLAVLPACE